MQNAVTVIIRRASDPPNLPKEFAAELSGLLENLEIPVVREIIVNLRDPSPRFLVGDGKAEEIAGIAEEAEADFIVFDDDLSPSQQRNWEKMTGLCVIDRQEVILEIFADRAQTREAVLQVGLARLEYSLPRLTRAWTHLSRQRGGRRGTKGEGETQLEIDRRIVERKIQKFKKELKAVRESRSTQRKQRVGVPVPTGAIVGYTNAGKSSLLNAVTGSSVYADDKLFATLDPTTRRVVLPGGREVLLTDTVGFIRKLPHTLVEAFKATLEETILADFLVHVVDISNPEARHHYEATLAVLREIGAGEKPAITVFNKIDMIPTGPNAAADELSIAAPVSAPEITHHLPLWADGIPVSAMNGAGIESLRGEIERITAPSETAVRFLLPFSRLDILALIRRTGTVLKEDFNGENVTVEALVTDKTRSVLSPYLVP